MRRRVFPAVFAIARGMGAVCAPARATDWTPAGETGQGNPVFVDRGGMRAAGTMRTAWIRVVYRSPIQAGTARVASMQALAHFDCASGENAGLRVLMYEDEAGTQLAIAREEREVRFGTEPEGSVGRIAHAAVCKDE
ncbi:MAG: surface-adhesin E family protein [Tagaea sp.]